MEPLNDNNMKACAGQFPEIIIEHEFLAILEKTLVEEINRDPILCEKLPANTIGILKNDDNQILGLVLKKLSNIMNTYVITPYNSEFDDHRRIECTDNYNKDDIRGSLFNHQGCPRCMKCIHKYRQQRKAFFSNRSRKAKSNKRKLEGENEKRSESVNKLKLENDQLRQKINESRRANINLKKRLKNIADKNDRLKNS